MISPGATVVCLQTGDRAWVVHRVWPDQRALLIGKVTDGRRAAYEIRSASLGDLVEVAPPPSFTPGEQIELDGLSYEVIADHGAEVECIAPSKSFSHVAGVRLAIPGGNRISFAKSDLSLNSI